MWADHVRSSVIWTPRNLKLLTRSTGAPSMMILLSPEIHLKLLSFADVEWEVVFLAPACQSMHLNSVGRLIIDMWTWRILLKPASHICTQAMLPALEAILGHRSAHSLVTGPVIAEPTKDNKNYLVLHLSKTQNIVKITGLKKNMFHHGLRFNSTWRLPSHPTAMRFTIPSLTTHPATEQTKQVL